MHPNPAFRKPSATRNRDYARERGFGVLSLNAPNNSTDTAINGPLISHVPFLLNADGDSLDLHLVRSNPILRLLQDGPQPAVIAVSGPDGYVSPDWYEVPDQVPTWNYVAVHLRGMIEVLPQEDMRAMLDRQSAHFEALLPHKTPWTIDKMTPEVLEKMMRQIVPCRMTVTATEGTWKLNQNKPDDVRLRAADQMEAYGTGQEVRLLAALMRGPFSP